MRVRSEWITTFTVTSLAVCGLALPRHATAPSLESRRKDIAAVGIDFTPTGTVKNIEKARTVRRQHL